MKDKKPQIALVIVITVLSFNQVVDSYHDYQFRCQLRTQYSEILQSNLDILESQNQIITILELIPEILKID